MLLCSIRSKWPIFQSAFGNLLAVSWNGSCRFEGVRQVQYLGLIIGIYIFIFIDQFLQSLISIADIISRNITFLTPNMRAHFIRNCCKFFFANRKKICWGNASDTETLNTWVGSSRCITATICCSYSIDKRNLGRISNSLPGVQVKQHTGSKVDNVYTANKFIFPHVKIISLFFYKSYRENTLVCVYVCVTHIGMTFFHPIFCLFG